MTKRIPPGKYSAMMSRAARKSRGSTSAKRKAALAKATEATKRALKDMQSRKSENPAGHTQRGSLRGRARGRP